LSTYNSTWEKDAGFPQQNGDDLSQNQTPGRTKDGKLYILLQGNFPVSPRLAPVPGALRHRIGG
jgi:hypothetical protein